MNNVLSRINQMNAQLWIDSKTAYGVGTISSPIQAIPSVTMPVTSIQLTNLPTVSMAPDYATYLQQIMQNQRSADEHESAMKALKEELEKAREKIAEMALAMTLEETEKQAQPTAAMPIVEAKPSIPVRALSRQHQRAGLFCIFDER